MTDSTERLPAVMGLIPTWKSADFIERTLESLAGQRYANIRFLISDDASPDNTEEVCRRFVARDDRFRYVRQPRNLGWIGNVNWLIGSADSDYVFLAYHDDLYLPAYVERLVEAIAARPGAICAFPDIVITNQTGEAVQYSYPHLEGAQRAAERVRVLLSEPHRIWIPHRGVMNLTVLRRIGGLRRHLGGAAGADRPWVVKMAIEGELVRVAEPLIRKWKRSEGVSSNWTRGRLQMAATRHAEGVAALGADLSIAEKVNLYRQVLTRCVRIAIGPVRRR